LTISSVGIFLLGWLAGVVSPLLAVVPVLLAGVGIACAVGIKRGGDGSALGGIAVGLLEAACVLFVSIGLWVCPDPSGLSAFGSPPPDDAAHRRANLITMLVMSLPALLPLWATVACAWVVWLSAHDEYGDADGEG